MDFTYNGYMEMLDLLESKGYVFSSYTDWEYNKRCVILRHDIDYDIEKAVKMAELEYSGGVKSTYFVLLTSDFYNVFSRENIIRLKEITKRGHAIGLHFDEVQYPEIAENRLAMCKMIQYEADILGQAIGQRVTIVSMHRPGKFILEADLQIPEIINSYGQEYFRKFKYLSDSRRRWREPVEDIIKSGQYKRLHILTHAFWYSETETDIHGAVSEFVNNGCLNRYRHLQSNITDLEKIMKPEEIARENAL